MYAVNKDTGQLIWGYTVGGTPQAKPTVSRVGAFFTASDGFIYCLGHNSSLIWNQKMNASPSSGTTLYRGILYAPVIGNRLLAFNPDNGSPAGNVTLSGQISAPPVFSRGRMLVTYKTGYVAAYGEASDISIDYLETNVKYPLRGDAVTVDVGVVNRGGRLFTQLM